MSSYQTSSPKKPCNLLKRLDASRSLIRSRTGWYLVLFFRSSDWSGTVLITSNKPPQASHITYSRAIHTLHKQKTSRESQLDQKQNWLVSGAFLQKLRLERHSAHHIKQAPQPSHVTYSKAIHNLHKQKTSRESQLDQKQNWLVSGAFLQKLRLERHSAHHIKQAPRPSHVTYSRAIHNLHKQKTSRESQLDQKQNWLVSGAFLQKLRLERHSAHHIKQAPQASHVTYSRAIHNLYKQNNGSESQLDQKQNWLVSGAFLQKLRLERHSAHHIKQAPQPSHVTYSKAIHDLHKQKNGSESQLDQKQNWLVSGAFLQKLRLERHSAHHIKQAPPSKPCNLLKSNPHSAQAKD